MKEKHYLVKEFLFEWVVFDRKKYLKDPEDAEGIASCPTRYRARKIVKGLELLYVLEHKRKR